MLFELSPHFLANVVARAARQAEWFDKMKMEGILQLHENMVGTLPISASVINLVSSVQYYHQLSHEYNMAPWPRDYLFSCAIQKITQDYHQRLTAGCIPLYVLNALVDEYDVGLTLAAVDSLIEKALRILAEPMAPMAAYVNQHWTKLADYKYPSIFSNLFHNFLIHTCNY